MSLPPEVPLAKLTGAELSSRIAWAQVYLIHAHKANSLQEAPSEPALRAHIAYLRRLESAGRLYAHGPVEQLPNDGVCELGIIAAASAEEAEQIAASDPLHRLGYRINVVQTHIINEGLACYLARAMALRAQSSTTEFDTDAPVAHSSDGLVVGDGAEAQVHLISLVPTDKPRPADAASAIDDHFVWLRENEMAARLVSCGPVAPAELLPPGMWGGGLGIVATSREQAERIARSEPSGRAGYRTVAVRGWTISRGLVTPISRTLRALNDIPDQAGGA